VSLPEFKIGNLMARLEPILALIFVAGCASTDARWEAGVTRATDQEPPALVTSEVTVYMKKGFGIFELEAEKRSYACHSTTLLRRMGLVEGPVDPPPGKVLVLGEITTDELPRDDVRSKIKGKEFQRVFGIGDDELTLFETYPTPRSIELGIERLKEIAASIGADEVRDVFFTGYAEHQMWEGDTLSVTPTSTDAFLYASISLLDFRLRDVRFHGTAVRRR
jgi:hypothetical protein